MTVQAPNRPEAGDTPRPEPSMLRDMVWISGGEFRMGSDDHYPEEAPAHRVAVTGFFLDRHPVAAQ